MKSATITLRVSTVTHDSDVLRMVPAIIMARFAGTDVRVESAEYVADDDVTVYENPGMPCPDGIENCPINHARN